jgi:hypothetical protein
MNERLNELRLDAGIAQLKDDPRLVVIDREGNVIDPLIGLEKFAELIVRECRDIVEQDMKLAHIQMIPLTLEKYANGRLKEKIREHFGVEE